MAIQDKAMKAAEKYLKITGRELLYNYGDDILVYMDEDEVCIGKLYVSTDQIGSNTSDNRITMDQFEEVMHYVINDNDDVLDKAIRPDLIEMYIINGDRAIIKHTHNSGCLGWQCKLM